VVVQRILVSILLKLIIEIHFDQLGHIAIDLALAPQILFKPRNIVHLTHNLILKSLRFRKDLISSMISISSHFIAVCFRFHFVK